MTCRNVIVLVLDTVREDIFRQEATRLQSLADYGHRQTYAAAHYTTPSHASMFTGDLPSEHGVHSQSPDYSSLTTSDEVLPKQCEQRFNAQTIGVSANGGFLSKQYSFDELFETFVGFDGNTMRRPDGLNLNAFLSEAETSPPQSYVDYFRESISSDAPFDSLLNGAFAKFLDIAQGTSVPRLGDYGAKPACQTALDHLSLSNANSNPKFLFMNLIDAHGPFTPPQGWSVDDVSRTWDSRTTSAWEICTSDANKFKDYLEQYRAMYRAAVRYLDTQLSQFIKSVKEATDRETTILITADHGEELGNERIGRGALGHKDLTAPVLHVPFYVVNPPEGADVWNAKLPEILSLLDLPEIVTAVMGGHAPEISRDIAPVEKLGHPKAPVDDSDAKYWTRAARVAIHQDTTAVRWDSLGTSESLTYGRSTESRNHTLDDIPDWAQQQFSIPLSELAIESRGNESVDPAVQSQLEELGYL